MILSELIKYIDLFDDFECIENKQKGTLVIRTPNIIFNFEKDKITSIEKDGLCFMGKEIDSFFNMKAFW